MPTNRNTSRSNVKSVVASTATTNNISLTEEQLELATDLYLANENYSELDAIKQAQLPVM